VTTGPETDTTARVVDDQVLDILFRKARTHNEWLDRPVGDDVLRTLYEVMKWGPTSGNLCPIRILFLRTAKSKERLIPCLAPGNVEKTRTAPVTAIIGFDLQFYRQAPKLFPSRPEIGEHFGRLPSGTVEAHAFRNGTLQGGYFILAARALGIDCGPISGFDNEKVDAEFFADGKVRGASGEESGWANVRSNFLCNLGYGDRSKLFPRNPRLGFEDACRLL